MDADKEKDYYAMMLNVISGLEDDLGSKSRTKRGDCLGSEDIGNMLKRRSRAIFRKLV